MSQQDQFKAKVAMGLFFVFAVGYFSVGLLREPPPSPGALETQKEDDLVSSAEIEMKNEFMARAKAFAPKIPLTKDLDELAESERLPRLLDAAGEMLKIRKAVSKHSILKEAGFKFYLQCSLNAEIVKSFRAQCWNQAQQLYFEVFAKELDPSIVPVSILRIAQLSQRHH